MNLMIYGVVLLLKEVVKRLRIKNGLKLKKRYLLTTL